MAISVIDASVALKWLVEEPGSPQAFRLLQNQAETAGDREILIAPAFVLLEVHYVLSKMFMARKIKRQQLEGGIGFIRESIMLEPLDDRMALQAEAVSMSALSPEASKAVHGGHPPFSIYDSVYIAMARRYGAALATADLQQAAAASALGVAVRAF
jgi:predicted nucleic acid-binding protein